jgi:hypothetical protein
MLYEVRPAVAGTHARATDRLARAKRKSPVRKIPISPSDAAIKRNGGFGMMSPYPTVENVTILKYNEALQVLSVIALSQWYKHE